MSGTKHDQGKPDYTYISVELLDTMAAVRAFGAKKYSRSNWKRGFKVTRSLAAALRHIFAFLSGQTNDPESGLPHLGHAMCCLEHAIYDMIHHPHNDDRDTTEDKVPAPLPSSPELETPKVRMYDDWAPRGGLPGAFIDHTPKDHKSIIDQDEHDRRERWIAK